MHLSWISIIRLGLVQASLGAIVVLTTSTLNRLMVVEFALPATLPGILVGLHYGVQLSRPRWGFISDLEGQRTKWILRGVGVLGIGALMAAGGVLLFVTSFWIGLFVSLVAYTLIGIGVGAGGTSMLALLATATAPRRRAAAATITWLMMIFGIAMTAVIAGAALDPYSPQRLMMVVAAVVLATWIISTAAVWRIEHGLAPTEPEPDAPGFWEGLVEVWSDARARRFTVFVFLSMTAYFMQELILEPYAGLVFAFTPGESTSLSGAQNGGVFVGMALVGIAATGLKLGSLRGWVVAGCIGSAAALGAIAALGPLGTGAPLVPAVVTLGFFNGMFAVAAIGSMMALAGQGRERREGTRMGLWGAAQAIAAGAGGLLGAASVDILRVSLGSDAPAFGVVFLFEAAIFLAAALMAMRVIENSQATGVSAAAIPGE